MKSLAILLDVLNWTIKYNVTSNHSYPPFRLYYSRNGG
nr:MAG TPA: hypothetical protein [Caudoviricetes sp.]